MGELKYDPIKHAKALIHNGGSCGGACGCDACFAVECRSDCYPDYAYRAAKRYLEEHDNRGVCESLW